ncbi:MAG: peptidylprolyl isomerase [Acidobacteriia bacterium]|nr:peptidylprolyl isomerase [Terriglobia bacterium]
MFDLFRSRAKAVRIMLGALLAMVALSMLVYLIPGAGMPTGDRSDQVVADIGKDQVTVEQIEQQIRNMTQGSRVPPGMVEVYIPQMIDKAIADRAVAYEAQRLGFQASDSDLANVIRTTQFGTLPPDQYRQAVEQQVQTTVADFERNMRLNILADALATISTEGVVISPAEVETAYRAQNEKIKFEYIGMDPNRLSTEAKPSAEELRSYFDQNRGFFPLPETRDLQLIVADQAKVAESIPVADAQVQAFYNSQRDQFRTPERVHARHILLSTTGKSDADKVKIKARAEDLLKQLKAGGDFAKLAEKNSEDPGSATKGGDLGWVVRGQMVKEFEDTTFALKPKEISNVITTQYGYHIIQVMEKEPARLQTLEEVKPQILTAIRNQTVFDRMQTLADQAHTELAKAPHNAEQVANKLNLQFVKVDKYRAGGSITVLGPDTQVSSAVSSMEKDQVTPVIQAGNKLVVAVVTAIIPSHPAEYSDVEQLVRQTYTQRMGTTLVTEKSKKLTDLLKTNGGDLKAAAKSLSLEVKTADFFSRDGAAEGIGPGRALNEAFDKPDGTLIGPVLVGGQTVFGKVVERQAADMKKLGEQRDTIVSKLKAQKAQDRAALLQDSIVTRLVQEGKIKKHQDVINRLMARYHT